MLLPALTAFVPSVVKSPFFTFNAVEDHIKSTHEPFSLPWNLLVVVL
jgi:hypothetical protein